MRSVAEYCKMTGVELSTMLDDLKWCFDTPASTVVELALKRLRIPAFYANLLNDIGVLEVRSTITAAGGTVDIAQLVHSHLYGTGQGICRRTTQLDFGGWHHYFGGEGFEYAAYGDADRDGKGAVHGSRVVC